MGSVGELMKTEMPISLCGKTENPGREDMCTARTLPGVLAGPKEVGDELAGPWQDEEDRREPSIHHQKLMETLGGTADGWEVKEGKPDDLSTHKGLQSAF